MIRLKKRYFVFISCFKNWWITVKTTLQNFWKSQVTKEFFFFQKHVLKSHRKLVWGVSQDKRILFSILDNSEIWRIYITYIFVNVLHETFLIFLRRTVIIRQEVSSVHSLPEFMNYLIRQRTFQKIYVIFTTFIHISDHL